jgi:hypothetical protein
VIGVDVQLDSFVSHQPAIPNLERIREVGLECFLEEQGERRLLVEQLLEHYNDGRSMTFYCTACALVPVEVIQEAITSDEGPDVDRQLDPAGYKERARAMRASVQHRASAMGIDLRLRKQRR